MGSILNHLTCRIRRPSQLPCSLSRTCWGAAGVRSGTVSAPETDRSSETNMAAGWAECTAAGRNCGAAGACSSEPDDTHLVRPGDSQSTGSAGGENEADSSVWRHRYIYWVSINILISSQTFALVRNGSAKGRVTFEIHWQSSYKVPTNFWSSYKRSLFMSHHLHVNHLLYPSTSCSKLFFSHQQIKTQNS